jgi:NAD(P)-dependent dehydrogenase (short-subunit alcohol dehydrogenase family)
MPRARELDLVGKVAVISGASRGIGRAVAFNLASRGCSILGTCTKDAGLTLLAELDAQVTSDVYQATSRKRPSDQTITGLVADIFSPNCATTIANAIDQHHGGKVDIFINSAVRTSP